MNRTATHRRPSAPAAASRWWHPRQVDATAKADAVRKVLALARDSLSMEVGYFGTFDATSQTYQVVDGASRDGRRLGPLEGNSLVLDQTLCWQVVSGRMGNAVPDAAAERVTRDLRPVTDENVRAYLGVPVHADGDMLGFLCLLSSTPRPDLGATEVALLRIFAEVVALQLADAASGRDEGDDLEALQGFLAPASPDLVVVYQPVAQIAARLLDHHALRVRSVEALSRFPSARGEPVEHWFDLAWRHGRGVDLELAAIQRAFDALPLLPDPIRLAVNVSPETLASSRLRDAIPLAEAHRITVELTEHMLLDDYSALRPALERVRETGVSLAIDDLGTGSSNLQHVIELAPDVLKIDLSITDGVESDPRRRALVSALVGFARDTGMRLVTEGVERLATARELDRLGVEYGQGWWLSRAVDLDHLPELTSMDPHAA
jgi:EAL domain-containing protein (putative c-di-GMP-specific phosphodiesterase class I)